MIDNNILSNKKNRILINDQNKKNQKTEEFKKLMISHRKYQIILQNLKILPYMKGSKSLLKKRLKSCKFQNNNYFRKKINPR